MTGVNLDPTLSIDFKYDWSQLGPSLYFDVKLLLGSIWTPLCPLTLSMTWVNLEPTLSIDVNMTGVNLDPILSIDFKLKYVMTGVHNGPHSVY